MAINKKFGSFEFFKTEFEATTIDQVSTGESNVWGWLVFNKQTGDLEITTTRNH